MALGLFDLSQSTAVSSVFSNGASLTSTQIGYGDSAGKIKGDSAFTRGTLTLSVDANTDNTFQTGYGMMGLVPSGTTTNFYLAQASNYTTSAYALRQNSAGTTQVNAATGQSLFLSINGGAKGTLTASSFTFASGVPVTISDTTASTSSSTGALVIAGTGGLGVGGVIQAGSNIASGGIIYTGGAFQATSAKTAALNAIQPSWYKSGSGASAPYDVAGNLVFEAANTAGAGFAWMVGTTPTYTARLDASGLALVAAGGGISIKSGSNARCGTATLVAGTVTVANTSVTANTLVMCTVQAPGGTQGFLSTSKVNATSFTITSTSGTETSVVAWELIENP